MIDTFPGSKERQKDNGTVEGLTGISLGKVSCIIAKERIGEVR